MTETQFPNGADVTFKPGRSTNYVTAKVEGREGQFLVTKDAAGKVRKVRPGACKLAA